MENDKQWRFTGIYREFKWEEKYLTWQRMRDLKASHDLPWVMMGDFNEILYLHEKEVGNPRPQQYMNAFRDALVNMVDMVTWVFWETNSLGGEEDPRAIGSSGGQFEFYEYHAKCSGD